MYGAITAILPIPNFSVLPMVRLEIKVAAKKI
jgi:hypothetical protein